MYTYKLAILNKKYYLTLTLSYFYKICESVCNYKPTAMKPTGMDCFWVQGCPSRLRFFRSHLSGLVQNWAFSMVQN